MPRESFVRISSRKQVPLNEVWDALRLEEHKLYRVEVMAHSSNPKHMSFLFTGFRTGSYSEVSKPSYEQPMALTQVHWIRIVDELGSTKDFGVISPGEGQPS